MPSGEKRREIDSLLVAVSKGDEAAFAGLYDATAGVVYGLALRVVCDQARAEEIAQETFVQVWRQAPRFDPGRGSATACITTIAHRRAVDFVRSEQASRDRIERAAVARPDTPFDSVASEVEEASDAALVRSALEHLTDVQREALSLAYFDGYTYREVAEIVQAPLGTVKTRIRDGLRHLGKLMGVGDG